MALQTFNPTGLVKPRDTSLQAAMGTELDNAFKRVQNAQEPQRFAQEQSLHHAQEQNQMRQAQFGNLQGPAAKLFSIRALEQQLGPNDPTVQAAKEELRLEQESQRYTNERNRVLNETAYQRMSTPEGRRLFEEREVDAGYAPGTMDSENPIRLTPEQQQEYKGQMIQQRKIKSTDSNARQKELVAENLDQTGDLINIDELVKFSGLQGGIQKKIEESKSLTGKESEAYRKFQENLVRAEVWADQIRNYFGGSVSPSMTKRLEELTNPTAWTRSPETAKRNVLALKELLKIESQTYKKAANPGTFEQQAAQQMAQGQQNGNTVKRIFKGVPVNIPEQLVAQFDMENANG
jgi:hypothetical protein